MLQFNVLQRIMFDFGLLGLLGVGLFWPGGTQLILRLYGYTVN